MRSVTRKSKMRLVRFAKLSEQVLTAGTIVIVNRMDQLVVIVLQKCDALPCPIRIEIPEGVRVNKHFRVGCDVDVEKLK
ncbi:hypothetical protein ABW17_26870 [Mycobacterium nebraskense]|nr:hypothetical protein ABW17_26870 [Mycobacterium nebraskense]